METEPNGPETRLVLAWPLTSPLQTYCSEAFRRHIPAPVAVCMRVCVCVCVGGGGRGGGDKTVTCCIRDYNCSPLP